MAKMNKKLKMALIAGVVLSPVFIPVGTARAAEKPAESAGFKDTFLSFKKKIRSWFGPAENAPCLLDGFEDAEKDFGWETQGYVVLKPSLEHATGGQGACQAVFTVPSDFKTAKSASDLSLTPIYTEAQVLNLTAGAKTSKTSLSPLTVTAAVLAANPATVWTPSMTLSWNTLTRLSQYDWSGYAFLTLSVFNPQKKGVGLGLKILDGKGYEFRYLFPLPAQKQTAAKLALQSVADQRLDLHNVQAVTFFVDSAKEDKDVTLYMDDLTLVPVEKTAPPKK